MIPAGTENLTEPQPPPPIDPPRRLAARLLAQMDQVETTISRVLQDPAVVFKWETEGVSRSTMRRISLRLFALAWLAVLTLIASTFLILCVEIGRGAGWIDPRYVSTAQISLGRVWAPMMILVSIPVLFSFNDRRFLPLNGLADMMRVLTANLPWLRLASLHVDLPLVLMRELLPAVVLVLALGVALAGGLDTLLAPEALAAVDPSRSGWTGVAILVCSCALYWAARVMLLPEASRDQKIRKHRLRVFTWALAVGISLMWSVVEVSRGAEALKLIVLVFATLTNFDRLANSYQNLRSAVHEPPKDLVILRG